MAHALENASEANTLSGEGWKVVGVSSVIVLLGVAFALFAANDLTGGPEDEDDDWFDMFNPPWAPG